MEDEEFEGNYVPLETELEGYEWRVEKCTRCGALVIESELHNGLCSICADDMGVT